MNDLIEKLRVLSALRNSAPLHESSNTESVLLSSAADEIEKLRAERDALRARIKAAMVVKATRNGIVRSEARMTLIGKRVALVVLEGGES